MKAITCFCFSMVVHGALLGLLSGTARPAGEEADAIRVKIVSTPKPKAAPAVVAKPQPPPPPKVTKSVKPAPEPKPQPEPVSPPVAAEPQTEQTETATTASAAKPSKDEGGVEGPDDSRPAELIHESFRRPRYTPMARRAGYEAEVIARILVDANGRVEKVEFGSDVQYGMDERIIDSLKRARFRPSKTAWVFHAKRGPNCASNSK